MKTYLQLSPALSAGPASLSPGKCKHKQLTSLSPESARFWGLLQVPASLPTPRIPLESCHSSTLCFSSMIGIKDYFFLYILPLDFLKPFLINLFLEPRFHAGPIRTGLSSAGFACQIPFLCPSAGGAQADDFLLQVHDDNHMAELLHSCLDVNSHL